MPDLWDAICAMSAHKPKAPARPTRGATPVADPAAVERALLDALCGGMAQWTDDAQIFIIHHWHCQECGATGQFPNIEPGRMVRRHNRQGTSWTCHDANPLSHANLPREFQHHHHPVGWCTSCIQETNPNQYVMALPQLHRHARGSGHHFTSMRMRAHV